MKTVLGVVPPAQLIAESLKEKKASMQCLILEISLVSAPWRDLSTNPFWKCEDRFYRTVMRPTDWKEDE
jgi:hypothetical protein